MKIDPSHPRATSLLIREKLVAGVKSGITSYAGLLAHGRGEAFDYLLGEKTHSFASLSIDAAVHLLLSARHPILSINGNSAALALDEFIDLAKLLDCKIEVNLFHYSPDRVIAIENLIQNKASQVLLRSSNEKKFVIPAIKSHRKVMINKGIGLSDVVFIPLEDGDRSEKLIQLGKKVITIDLNPLSRTAQSATITIIDNIVRTMPLLISALQKMKHYTSEEMAYIKKYKNTKTLSNAIRYISNRLQTLADISSS